MKQATRDLVHRVVLVSAVEPLSHENAQIVQDLGDHGRSAARRAKLTDYAAEFIEPELTWTQQLAMQLRSRLVGLLHSSSPGEAALAQLAQRLDPVARAAQRLARLSVPNRLYAYCFCEAQ